MIQTILPVTGFLCNLVTLGCAKGFISAWPYRIVATNTLNGRAYSIHPCHCSGNWTMEPLIASMPYVCVATTLYREREYHRFDGFQKKLQLHNWGTSIQHTINKISLQCNYKLMFNVGRRVPRKANFVQLKCALSMDPGSLRSHFFLPCVKKYVEPYLQISKIVKYKDFWKFLGERFSICPQFLMKSMALFCGVCPNWLVVTF